MPYVIHTERLTLRPIALTDFDFLRSMHLNPEVMKFIGRGRQRTEVESRQAIERVMKLAETQPVLGLWIVEMKDTHEPIGNFVLRNPATDEATEGLEVGFSFIPSSWGKGIALESIKAVCEYSRQHLPNHRLIALVDPSNEASMKVLGKAGFVVVGAVNYVDIGTGALLPSNLLELKS